MITHRIFLIGNLLNNFFRSETCPNRFVDKSRCFSFIFMKIPRAVFEIGNAVINSVNNNIGYIYINTMIFVVDNFQIISSIVLDPYDRMRLDSIVSDFSRAFLSLLLLLLLFFIYLFHFRWDT